MANNIGRPSAPPPPSTIKLGDKTPAQTSTTPALPTELKKKPRPEPDDRQRLAAGKATLTKRKVAKSFGADAAPTEAREVDEPDPGEPLADPLLEQLRRALGTPRLPKAEATADTKLSFAAF